METRARLERAGVAAAPAEARWLVEEAAGLDATELDEPATQRRLAHLDALVARRVAGEPVQYVLGHWAFRHLDLLVDRRVLIPRPETEVLVGVALDRLAAGPGGEPPIAVDLGTGSGAIALSLLREHPTVEVWATDRSPQAIEVATANAAGSAGRGAARLRIVEGDWFEALPAELGGRVDLVVSNPPYVADGEELAPSVLDFEPAEALRAGPDGLDDLRVIIAGVGGWLRPGGWVVVEHGEGQADAVGALMRAAGLVEIAVHADLTRRARVTSGRRGTTQSVDSSQEPHHE